MRQDKTVARILLIISVANIALAAPAAVRPRHLDVAKAASEKRAPGSVNGETGGDLPPESSSAAANHPTTEALGESGSGNGATDELPPVSPSAAANRITTQASEAPGSGNRITGNLPPESSSLHDNPTQDWEWFHRLSSEPEVPESSSAAANRITTPASGSPGSSNGAMVYSSSESPSRTPPHSSPTHEEALGDGASSSHSSPTNEWAWLDNAESESSSTAANRITTQASGAPGPEIGATGDLPPESPSAAANHITTQASGHMTPSSPAHVGDLPPHQGSPETLAGANRNWLLRNERARTILLYVGFSAVLHGAVAAGYEMAN